MSLLFLIIFVPLITSKKYYRWNSRRYRPQTTKDDNYGHNVCFGERQSWDPPSTSLNNKNKIGRAIYQTSFKVRQATSLIRYGKSYDLAHIFDENAPGFGHNLGWTLDIEHTCSEFSVNAGLCQTELYTNAVDNYGTQFDYLSHFWGINTDNPSANPNENVVFFNDIKGSDIFNDNGVYNFTEKGLASVGIQAMPTLFTRAFLLDIPRYKGLNVLPDRYQITSNDIRNTLRYQGLSVYDLSRGDVVIYYTGWERYVTNLNIFYSDRLPVVKMEVFKDIFDKRGIMVVGMDTPSIEWDPFDIHLHWLVCKGGFFHEGMLLSKWIKDTRQHRAPYVGAYVFEPIPINGAFGSGGRPMIYY